MRVETYSLPSQLPRLTTVVESICLLNVQLTQHSSPAHWNTWVSGPQCVQWWMPREEVRIVMHYTVIVIANSERIDLRRRQSIEVCLVAWNYILTEYLDVLITIRATLLMPEPNNMANLVDDCVKVETRASQRDTLRMPAVSDSSHIRTAPTIEGKTIDLSFTHQQDEGNKENSHTSTNR